MTSEARKAIALDESQEKALKFLARKILDTHHGLTASGDRSTLSVVRGEEFTNVFGVVGPRGAGKSTLLTQLEIEHETLSKEEELADFKELKIIPALDCSTLLDGVEPGMAILIHLGSEVEKDLKRVGVAPPLGGKGKRHTLDDQLKKILSTYMWSLDSYRELELDLASSPENFAQELVEDTRQRMQLKKNLALWICSLLKDLKKEALVVLLDDFDLIHAAQVRKWFNCLLDEFHQANVFFVLTGDFHRLEHLIFDHEAEIDDKTARAQLEKILPLHHRVRVDPWSGKSRKEWPPWAPQGEKLKDLIQRVDAQVNPALLFHLLPSRPRGVNNLYHQLSGLSPSAPLSPNQFLETLATCRGEPLLSRHLKKNGAGDWSVLFRLEETSLPPEVWREGVHAARQRTLEEPPDQLAPVRGLELSPPGSLKKHLPRRAGVLKSQAPEILSVETSSAAESQDPLRHEHLWHAPLRDAGEAAQPYWAELLLDLSFVGSGDEKDDVRWAVRNRVGFVEAWRPARDRLRLARLDLDFSRERAGEYILRFLDDYEEHDLHSLLFWLDLDIKDGGANGQRGRRRLRIGWSNLFNSLRHGRTCLDVEEMSVLDLNPETLLSREGVATSTGINLREDSQQLEILPNRLWAMILLIDAIDRCPWSVFSVRLGWSLPTYLVLVGAFLHGAYLHALKTAGFLKGKRLKKAQRSMIDVLERRDASWILLGDERKDRFEENVLRRLNEVLASNLPSGGSWAEKESNPLWQAAERFFNLAPYRALKELAGEALDQYF